MAVVAVIAVAKFVVAVVVDVLALHDLQVDYCLDEVLLCFVQYQPLFFPLESVDDNAGLLHAHENHHILRLLLGH